MNISSISALDAIADAMNSLSSSDWDKIYDATRDRLLVTEYDGEDTPSNRVICEMIVMNALFDIRDARNKLRNNTLKSSL